MRSPSDKNSTRSSVEPRPVEELGEAMVARLMATVRGQFCGEMTDKEWFQHSHFVRWKIIAWPAGKMAKQGFFMDDADYERMFREIFEIIKRKGNTGVVKFWPGYLLKCVQSHWEHNWERYYDKTKSMARFADRALMALKSVPTAQDHTVRALATAHAVMTKRKVRKKAAQPPKQLGFLDL